MGDVGSHRLGKGVANGASSLQHAKVGGRLVHVNVSCWGTPPEETSETRPWCGGCLGPGGVHGGSG